MKNKKTVIIICIIAVVVLASAAAICIFAGRSSGRRSDTQTAEATCLIIGDSYAGKLESLGYQSDTVTIYAVPGITAAQLYESRDEFPEERYDMVVLMVGINTLDVTEGEVIVNDEITLIEYLRELYGVSVYVQKVFPVAEALVASHEMLTVENVAEYNRLLEEYCDETDGVYFFDATDGFVDEDGYLTCTEDYLHIADEYIDEYYSNVMTAIEEAG